MFPFTEQQIDQIIGLYTGLKGALSVDVMPCYRSLTSRVAIHNIPALGWLLGVVMPLESIGSRLNGSLEALMEDLQL